MPHAALASLQSATPLAANLYELLGSMADGQRFLLPSHPRYSEARGLHRVEVAGRQQAGSGAHLCRAWRAGLLRLLHTTRSRLAGAHTAGATRVLSCSSWVPSSCR